MTTISNLVHRAYEVRPCFICGKLGPCPHREFEVEAALIAAEYSRQAESYNNEPQG